MMIDEPNAMAATEDFEFAALAEAGNYRAAIINEFKCHLGGRVLEHIEDDLAELARLRQILCGASGHLCILVPARPEIFSKLDAHFGHFRRYTRAGLHAKLRLAGFEIIALHYFNCIGYFAWWLRFKVMQSMSFDVNQVRLFDRVIFPLAYALESRLMRPPIGQSLIAIGRARSV